MHSRPDNISSLSPPLTFSEQISSIDTIFPAFGFQFFHVVFMQQHIRINSLTDGSCFSLILVSFCSAPLPLSLSLRSCSSFTWTCLVVACAVPATRHHLLLRHNRRNSRKLKLRCCSFLDCPPRPFLFFILAVSLELWMVVCFYGTILLCHSFLEGL